MHHRGGAQADKSAKFGQNRLCALAGGSKRLKGSLKDFYFDDFVRLGSSINHFNHRIVQFILFYKINIPMRGEIL